MPIVVNASKLTVSRDDLIKFIELLNVELHLFDTKKFQDFAHKLIGLYVAKTLRDFLALLDTTALQHFADIVICSNKTVDGIATFLKGSEIEQNYLKIYGPSCRIGMPVAVPQKVEVPVPVVIGGHFPFGPPVVNPAIPIFPKPAKVAGHVMVGHGHVMVGPHPAMIGMPAIDIGYGVVVGSPFGPVMIERR